MIATILMVAITVVLAAVLYVMVTGLIGGQTGGEPQVTFDAADNTSSGNWTIDVAAASRPEGQDKYQVTVLDDGVVAISAAALSTCDGSPGACASGALQIQFVDLTSDAKLGGGDYFLLSGADTTSDYTIKLIWANSGNQVGQRDINQ